MVIGTEIYQVIEGVDLIDGGVVGKIGDCSSMTYLDMGAIRAYGTDLWMTLHSSTSVVADQTLGRIRLQPLTKSAQRDCPAFPTVRASIIRMENLTASLADTWLAFAGYTEGIEKLCRATLATKPPYLDVSQAFAFTRENSPAALLTEFRVGTI